MIGIYKFTNKYNRKVYIGQSVNIKGRYQCHIRAALYRNEDTCFYRALRKYGIEGFDFDILIECPKENLNYWEEFYIKYYCANDNNFGYNRTRGGDKRGPGKVKGSHISEETKEKIRQYRLGLHQTNETKEKIRISNTGKKVSKETRLKASNTLKTVLGSEEHRIKQSIAIKMAWSSGKYNNRKRKYITKSKN